MSINLPSVKTEGYMYITEDVGDIYVDVSSNKRIRLNAEASEKIRKIIYNEDGTFSELSFDYDDLNELQQMIYNNTPTLIQERWKLGTDQSDVALRNNYSTDLMMVYYNGLLINNNIHYTYSESSKQLSFLGFSAEAGDILTVMQISAAGQGGIAINPAVLIGGAY